MNQDNSLGGWDSLAGSMNVKCIAYMLEAVMVEEYMKYPLVLQTDLLLKGSTLITLCQKNLKLISNSVISKRLDACDC